ncbi:flagellar biosynthesis protein FlhF [Oceanirhabdus sp. W0125-5]|uniref:flagellar biosynthesis protein FlhF n=1 Tax=Oceanirhabdus sp. W0125-5 TaxID=2999116 RepID=UPI0022F2FABE|nr:flagellar biosynthesis protein FlhF [Oceanirhabdus sp. W0125-5]WBW95414.1 flagellar biosynthesis protein FlhF [Oceanirhabdus sp. W0125-5]
MKVKRYIVNNMNEAISQIRIDLGKDAVIISQRKVRQKGFFGLFAPKQLEVTAAIENTKERVKSDTSNSSSYPNSFSQEDTNFNDSFKAITEALMQHNNENVRKPQNMSSTEEFNVNKSGNMNITEQYREKIKSKMENKPSKENLVKQDDSIIKELGELKKMISNINGNSVEDPSMNVMEEFLEEIDVFREFRDDFKEKVSFENEGELRSKVKTYLEEELSYCEFPKEGRIVLAGPTGVGKTTTIAKLAGKLSLQGNKKVGLITIDTYRIGAVEQLKTYAEIMNIPIKVVFNTKEMDIALKELEYCDIVLVDTTGRSSKNSMQVSELRSYIDRVATENIFLVVSATTKNKDLKTIINGFEKLNYNGIILTKLDETSTYGLAYNACKISNKPLSLVTIGQNVPDDIKEANSSYIANLIVGEETV